jgi:hypothetical protein
MAHSADSIVAEPLVRDSISLSQLDLDVLSITE